MSVSNSVVQTLPLSVQNRKIMSGATPANCVAQQQRLQDKCCPRYAGDQNNPTTSDNEQNNDTGGGSRRTRVYRVIIKKWKEAAKLAAAARGGPRPRSSHDRVLGGQALFTRQVDRARCITVMYYRL